VVRRSRTGDIHEDEAPAELDTSAVAVEFHNGAYGALRSEGTIGEP
jgi:hypothetical protein